MSDLRFAGDLKKIHRVEVSTAAGVKSSSIFCFLSELWSCSASPSLSHDRFRDIFLGSESCSVEAGVGSSNKSGLNLTIIAVMLSHPVPSPIVLGARQLWKS